MNSVILSGIIVLYAYMITLYIYLSWQFAVLGRAVQNACGSHARSATSRNAIIFPTRLLGHKDGNQHFHLVASDAEDRKIDIIMFPEELEEFLEKLQVCAANNQSFEMEIDI